MKEFVCDCVNPNFEELGVKDVNEFSDFIDNAKEITKNTFIKNCLLSESILQTIKQFPNDFDYFKNGNIYFFTHSAIEHFFK